MKVMFKGPSGSGKTTALLKKYQKAASKEGTDSILVLVKNAAAVGQWRKKLKIEVMGPLSIYTYFGFVQNQITGFWPEIEVGLPGEEQTIIPSYMNVETSHYVMTKFVEKNRQYRDLFDTITATSTRIAVQLIDNLNQAAMNCLKFKEMEQRLLKWAGDDREKQLVFNEAIDIMKIFREFCINNRILDYSLMIDLFNKYLFSSDQYLDSLLSEYKYIFVDDLEKTVPSAQKLILKFTNEGKKSFTAYNPEAGINRFFGGNPELAAERFFPLYDIVKMKKNYTCSEEARNLAESLYSKVFEEEKTEENDGFIKGIIETDFRGNMLVKTAKKVNELIKKGTETDQIVIIAPNIDKVLEFTLNYYLEEKGNRLLNLSDSKRLVDIPFAQALITLTLLCNSDWNIDITYSSLQQTLHLLLDIDPLTGSYLADKIMANNLEFPSIDEISFPIDFKKYNFLKQWLQKNSQQNLDLDVFFQTVFGQLLTPLSPSREDIQACRQMIDSVTKFRKVVQSFKEIEEEEIGKHFIDMIYSGTLAAEVLYNQNQNRNRVILTTPYNFIYSSIEKVKYIFWLDISSKDWLRGIGKELTNPYIFAPDWSGNWDDETDQEIRKKQLLNYLQCILSRSTSGLYLADSYLNSHGWEQEGQLYEWIQSYPEGGTDND